MHANETTRIDYLNQDITEHPATHKKGKPPAASQSDNKSLEELQRTGSTISNRHHHLNQGTIALLF
jgi:hypothetical protein